MTGAQPGANPGVGPNVLATQAFQYLRDQVRHEAEQNSPALQATMTNLEAYKRSIADLQHVVRDQRAGVQTWTGAARNAFDDQMDQHLAALDTMPQAVDTAIQAIDRLRTTIAETARKVEDVEPPRAPRAVAAGKVALMDQGVTGQDAANRVVDLINGMAPDYQAAAQALGVISTTQWPGPRSAAPAAPGASPPAGPGGPKGAGGGNPPGGAKAPGGAGAGKGAGGAGAGGAGAGGAGAGGAGTGGAGSPSASDPGSTGDQSATSPSGSAPSQQDPNLNIPNPNSPSINIPNPNIPSPDIPKPVVQKIDIPQLAGHQSTVQLPPNASITGPNAKIPDLNLGAGPGGSSGGPVALPPLGPPNGNSSGASLPGTQAPTGGAPGAAGLAGEAAAAAGTNRSGGMPYLPPPMGGMGAGGRGGAGVKPGTAEQAGGPGLGGPAAKPIEEIGVPARLRGRGAGTRAARPTRPTRPRGIGKGAAKGAASGAAPASSPAKGDSGEVLDEQLWHVQPPAMFDE
jgi:uncharacterized protein YukE